MEHITKRKRTIILLLTTILLSLFSLNSVSQIDAQNDVIRCVDDMDGRLCPPPRPIKLPPVDPPPNDPPSTTPSFDGFSWYFTFQSLSGDTFSVPQAQTVETEYCITVDDSWNCETVTEYVGFQVVLVIQLWQSESVVKTEHIGLSCDIEGSITYHQNGNGNWILQLIDNSYVFCDSLDLRNWVLGVSGGAIDPCEGVSECNIPVSNIFVEAEVQNLTSNPKPIFVYGDLNFSMGWQSMSLTIDDYSTTATGQTITSGSHFRIEQDDSLFKHYVNGAEIASFSHSSQFSFPSNNQTIYFGFDPESGAYFTDGIIGDGIFDPYSGGHYTD